MSAVLREVPKTRVTETIHLENVEWCELTSIGLKVNRKTASLEEMESTLNQLMIAAKGSPLAVGDAMCLGEKRHGDKWAQAVDAHKTTGIKVKTLLEYRRVSENVPFSIRLENQNVEWSHYQVIANRPEEERRQWVARVADHGWSVAQLKREINEAQRPTVDPLDDENYLDPNYKTFLLDYIASQYSFLNRCQYDPFKKEIEHTIRAAKFQHKRTLSSDFEAVKAQVDKMCTTPDEIADEVPLSEEEIKVFCARIIGCEQPSKAGDPVEAGTPYEWRPIGVNTDAAKGKRSYGIFRKDSPHYSGGGSGYSPTVDWED